VVGAGAGEATPGATPAGTKAKTAKPVARQPATGERLVEIREEDVRNRRRIRQEFDNIQRVLDGDESAYLKASGRRRQGAARRNPVAKLSDALRQYKSERIGTEDDLIKCIQKVNLDKAILFREKQGVLWKDADDQRQTSLEEALRKEKQMRHELNKKQKDAYELVLQFMKERNTKPVQEEK
jgi:hypothetical protein